MDLHSATGSRHLYGLLPVPLETAFRIETPRRGYSNAELAAELYLGETTVKTHLGRVLDKLELRDRSRAIAYAYESGLISPGESHP